MQLDRPVIVHLRKRRHSESFDRRYPVEDIEESFAEEIKTGHPMPEFQLDSAEIRDLLAYLKSLER
jgi:hypothetical protein